MTEKRMKYDRKINEVCRKKLMKYERETKEHESKINEVWHKRQLVEKIKAVHRKKKIGWQKKKLRHEK